MRDRGATRTNPPRRCARDCATGGLRTAGAAAPGDFVAGAGAATVGVVVVVVVVVVVAALVSGDVMALGAAGADAGLATEAAGAGFAAGVVA